MCLNLLHIMYSSLNDINLVFIDLSESPGNNYKVVVIIRRHIN